jgi:hypothetical protein
VPHQVVGWEAPRPANSALGSARCMLMPDLDLALQKYIVAVQSQERPVVF